MSFKVQNYHVKSHQSVWDAKTAVMDMRGDVDIAMYLTNQTTAHILSEHAVEDKSRSTGTAEGSVRALWQEMTVTSERAAWDLTGRAMSFFPAANSSASAPGHLSHLDFMNGRVEMDFRTLENAIDADDNSEMTAIPSQGVWTPYAHWKGEK